MTFICRSYSFLRVYTQGTFGLFRRNRTRGGRFVYARYMTRESTRFWKDKKEANFNKSSFYKKKIHQEFITSKVNKCFSLNLFLKTILSFGGLIYLLNKKNFNNVSYYPSFHALKTLKSPLSKLTIFFGSKLMHLTN